MPLRKILVATDLSEASRPALTRGAGLARATGASLLVAHAFDRERYQPSIGKAAAGRVAEELNAVQLRLQGTCAEIAHGGGPDATPLLVEGAADEEIAQTARTEAADLLVVGSHGHTGARRLILGSVAEHIVRLAEIPVLVARGEGTGPFAKILVATDFTPSAERALALALDVAAPGATIELVHSVQVAVAVNGEAPLLVAESLLPELEEEARRQGAALVDRFGRPGVTLRFAPELGAPRDVILRRAGEPFDLVALGSHGRRGLRRFLLGSVAETIVRHAPCSVLIAK